MIDPYRMVTINILGSFLLFLGIIFYKYFFPKRKFNFLILLILISLLPLTSLLRNGAYESGDFNIHIYRTMSFYDSLKEGNIMPSWAKDLNATYGYPLFIFNYTLPYYIISFFHFLGFTFIASMKIFLALTFILSGIFMYLFAKKLFKNDLAALTASIFYQFAPYHLIDQHFKIVIGELLIFTFLPLVFFTLLKSWEKKNRIWLPLAGISLALLIMSHVAIALFVIVLIFSFSLYLTYKTKKIYYCFYSIIISFIGALFSTHVWLTPFFLSRYTIYQPEKAGFVYFPKIIELLYSPWRFGFLYQGPEGHLSYLLGYIHIIVILASLIALLLRYRTKIKCTKDILFWLTAFFMTIFLISSSSKFLWALIPFIKSVGSQRLLILAGFISSILSGYLCLTYYKKYLFIYVIILITILSTILNWGHRRTTPEITDSVLLTNLPKSTSEGEGHFYANSKFRSWKNPWFSKLPKSHLELLNGDAKIKEIKRTSTFHSYLINGRTQLQLKENTLYFPGWEIFDNGKKIPVSHDKESIIIFNLSKGTHFVELRYTDLLVYRILKMISLTSLLILGIYILSCIFITLKKKLGLREHRFSS